MESDFGQTNSTALMGLHACIHHRCISRYWQTQTCESTTSAAKIYPYIVEARKWLGYTWRTHGWPW